LVREKLVRQTTRPRWRARIVGALGVAVAALVVLYAWPLPKAPEARYEGHAAGPADSRTIFWVGHSLLAYEDTHVEGPRNVMATVEALADARGLGYAGFDHTLWGSPLSLAYTGAPHGYERHEPDFVARLSELRERGERYDTLVLTDTVPIDAARRWEHTSYYATRFACDLLERNPDARVYLYESWVPLQLTGERDDLGSPAAWDWLEAMRREASSYREVADEVSSGRLVEPGRLGRWLRWLREPAACRPSRPVFVVPVASTFVALAERLRAERWEHAGRALAIDDFFVNPVVDWPEDWPREDVDRVEAERIVAGLTPRHADEPPDAIHPSELGSYFAGLVHFATLYRRSPEGSPPLASGLSPETAARLQALVWDVVRRDPRTGVAGE
jgi:hypothetical protein